MYNQSIHPKGMNVAYNYTTIKKKTMTLFQPLDQQLSLSRLCSLIPIWRKMKKRELLMISTSTMVP